MYTLINSTDYTDFVPPDSISIQKVLSDPMSTAALDVNDPGSTFPIHTLQEILILDENGLANPTWNLLLNPSLISTSSGNYFNTESSGAAPIMAFPGTGVTFTFSNNANLQWSQANQRIQNNLIVPGQQYMLSVYMQGSGALTGMTNSAFIAVQFLDGGGNNLGGPFSNFTPISSQQRINVYGPAPDGSVSAIVSLGCQSYSNTNSGVITYTTAQFEPMWFTGDGQNYPTPDCNPAQSNCYTMPNGTTVRQTRLFAGQIVDSHRMYDDASGDKGAGKDRTHSLTCNSAEWLLETTNLVNKSYTAMYDSAIIADILSTCFTVQGTGTGQVNPVPLLTGNHVQQGYFVADTLTWDGVSAREALNQLINLSNFSFWADDYFDLHYTPAFFGTTAFGLSDTPDGLTTFAYNDLEVGETGSQVKSRIQVNGGNYLQQTSDTFSGNGTNKVFTLTNQPDSIVSITVTGTAQVFKPVGQGTLGVGGLQATWDKSTKQIKFNTAPPNAANNVVVTYTCPTPVRVRVWDMGAISAQNGRFYDSKIEDSSLITPTAAIKRGEAEADVWSKPVNTYLFNTLQPIVPGNVVPFTCVSEGLSSYPLLCQKVTTTSPDGTGIYLYTVQAGQYLPDLIDLLTNTHKALNRSKHVAGLPLLQEVLYSHDSLTYAESWGGSGVGGGSGGGGGGGGGGSITPLTLYGIETSSSTVGTANEMVNTTG